MALSEEQIERYSRHILLKEVGVEGQEAILKAKILVIGIGGLGSPVAYYLAAAGIGTIGLADGDFVDTSNLQRQILHFSRDVGRSKVESAEEKLKALNPDIRILTYPFRLTSKNIGEIIQSYDFIVEGSDNFTTKFLVNDACHLNAKPLSIGGILRFSGQTTTILPGRSACYRCLFESAPQGADAPSCSEAGVLGAIAGMLGSIQAAEALKFITGTGQLLSNYLLSFDATSMTFNKFRLKKNDSCALCGQSPTLTTLNKIEPDTCGDHQ